MGKRTKNVRSNISQFCSRHWGGACLPFVCKIAKTDLKITTTLCPLSTPMQHSFPSVTHLRLKALVKDERKSIKVRSAGEHSERRAVLVCAEPLLVRDLR